MLDEYLLIFGEFMQRTKQEKSMLVPSRLNDAYAEKNDDFLCEK